MYVGSFSLQQASHHHHPSLRSIKSVVRMFDIRTHFTAHCPDVTQWVLWQNNQKIFQFEPITTKLALMNQTWIISPGLSYNGCLRPVYPPCVWILWLIVTIVFVTAWHSWHRAHYNRYCVTRVSTDQSEASMRLIWPIRSKDRLIVQAGVSGQGNKAIYLYWSHSRSLARYGEENKCLLLRQINKAKQNTKDFSVILIKISIISLSS